MKPDWDALAAEFNTSSTVLIGSVDCTVEKGLCSQHEVQGFPTVKSFPLGGSTTEGVLYKGGRDFHSLKKFADENLGPSCSNDYLDLCNDEQKATLEKYNAMTPAQRQKLLDDAEKAIEDVNRACR